MTKNLASIRGMPDIMPNVSHLWQNVESILDETVRQYGYQAIRTPILEPTQLFHRSIGNVTDIVAKEMYTLTDRKGASFSLRPEGTASCLRACIQHHSLHHQPIQRLYYSGPMFRYERPQKGRQRQFYQWGIEALGMPGPDIDVEILMMGMRLWKKFDLLNEVKLEINTLGSEVARKAHRQALLTYFKAHQYHLNEEEKYRLHHNPLRLLDSKNPQIQTLIKQAPSPIDYLDKESSDYFQSLTTLLNAAKIPYSINTHLVRGLDYYQHLVFEWVTETLGSQGTVCAGGRYNGLIQSLGGPDLPGIGFAIGLERLIMLLSSKKQHLLTCPSCTIYTVAMDDSLKNYALYVNEKLRDLFPDLSISLHCKPGSLKNQLKHANRSGAKFALIIGESELKNQQITLKYLREDKPQISLELNKLDEKFQEFLKN